MTRAVLLIALLPMATLAQSSTAKEPALGKQLAQEVNVLPRSSSTPPSCNT